MTHPQYPFIQVVWNHEVDQSSQLGALVTAAYQTEIPGSIRDAWLELAPLGDPFDSDVALEILQEELRRLNVERRRIGGDQVPLITTDDEPPPYTVYYYYDDARVCETIFPAYYGGSRWTVPSPIPGLPPAALSFGVGVRDALIP